MGAGGGGSEYADILPPIQLYWSIPQNQNNVIAAPVLYKPCKASENTCQIILLLQTLFQLFETAKSA